MRLKNECRVSREHVAHAPLVMVDRRTLNNEEQRTLNARTRELSETAQRLYRGAPTHSSPWWGSFSDGYPARACRTSGHWGAGIRLYESGEIELRDICGGSPSSCATRSAFVRMTEDMEITTWGERPVMWTESGRKLTRNDYRPLRRYVTPHQIDRDITNSCPTVLIDHELSIAAPLAYGENGMTAYWPDERSYPVTWSSWLVTIENEELNKIMASALRRVCKYANAMNSVMQGQELTDAAKAAYSKEGERAQIEWKTATKMVGYLAKSRDPKEIAQMIVDDHTSRQLVALGAILMSGQWSGTHHARYAAVYGQPNGIKFSTTSMTFRMLREQCSDQYETKFLYTKPPEYRSSWQLVKPPMG